MVRYARVVETGVRTTHIQLEQWRAGDGAAAGDEKEGAMQAMRRRVERFPVLLALLGLTSALPAYGAPASTATGKTSIQATPAELREIIKEAYVYGFPMVDSYRIQHSYFIDPGHPEYKGAWNEVHNVARVFTPQDKAIQTPNSDTPYSFLGADLRAEPLVISVPAIRDRYYSLQFIDMYTHNFAYVGSRATGSDAGHYLLAGPGWQGRVPHGIKSVIRSETDLAFILYRTQLFGSDDLDAVKKIQAQYRAQPLSRYAGTAPAATQSAAFVKPLSAEAQKSSPEFFGILNFLLQFAPTHPSETALMTRFARAGIGAGRPFEVAALTPGQREAVQQGMSDAWAEFAQYKATQIDTGRKSSADGFGTREFLRNDYLARMSSAVLGIYGNSKEEANYPAYFTDSQGKPLDGASNRYTVRFEPGRLPPVNSFWSLTMYELPASLLTENPIDRYLIDSPMEPELVRDADGGITLYVQHESPGEDKKANWLPAPKGPFFMIMRQYWPKPEALDGTWKAPPATRVEDSVPQAAAPTEPAASVSAIGATTTSKVPDLTSPQRWQTTTDGKIVVTPDNFVRAESDVYMAAQVKDGAFGNFKHTREPAPVDRQLIVRLNRDTIYSSGVFDLGAGPVTISLPDPGERFLSALVINQDHYNPHVFYGAGTHTLTKESVGTRYAMVGIRILADPNDPQDMKQANALQDAITVSQPGGPGVFEIPPWDPVSQKKVREALIALSNTIPDLRYAAGPDRNSVDPVRRIAAAASGWGLNPDKDAVYLNVFPEKNDGKTPYRLTVKDVPVDAFWSVTAYTADGYFNPNDLNAYSINSVTGKKNAEGVIAIQFGNCSKDTPNCLPVTEGWNYMVRLYRPRQEILDGSWSFPSAVAIE